MLKRFAQRFALLALLSSLPSLAAAQLADVDLAGQRLPAQVTVYPVYQSLSLVDRTITQTSVPVSLYVPYGRRWGLSVRAAWASASGDGLTSLSGITDAQAYLSYYQPVGRGSLVASLGTNLPSGKQQLTREEFATLALLSRNEYNFQTPSLGLGLGLSPGLTFAYPVGEALVLGGGAAYQYRGAFEPLENMPEAYTPGNELLLTGGFDVQLSRAVSLAADVTYTMYSTDEIGGMAVYGAGDKIVVEGRIRYAGPSNESYLSGRYRSRAKSSLAGAGGVLAEESEQTVPNQVEVFASHRMRFDGSFYGGVLGEVRLFEETPVLPGVSSLYGAGVSLEWVVSPALQIPVRFLYQFGDITGVEAGLGLRTRL